MTRLHSVATVARAWRVLLGIGAACVLTAAVSGCTSSQPAAPTPDPFAGLADRSDQAFRQGLESYGQGQYREALTSFEQARTLSPSGDSRIDQMIDRSRTALAPTATPVPPAPTEAPSVPSPTPVAMNALAPDADLGHRYFGQVTLVSVPGRDADAPAASQFFFQDQIGLHIDGLKQHLRLPLTLRVFNTDTAALVADVQSDDTPSALATPAPAAASRLSLVPPSLGSLVSSSLTSASTTPAASPASADRAAHLARFWDTYVWYHQGGEEPGRYRVELYAAGVLTNSFDYSVGSVPVPTPEAAPAAQVVEPTPSAQSVEPVAPPAPPAPPAPLPPVIQAAEPQPGPAAVAVAPTATPQATPIPSPTPLPTPVTAALTVIGGLPAGLDINPNDGRVFVADGSGVMWANDPQRPAIFNRPINLDHLPVDLAIDKTTANVFVSARNESAVLVMDASGRRLNTILMPVAPGDLQVDSELGLVYVALPERQAIAVIDGRAGRLLRTIDGLPQVTSLALDSQRHTLYVSHLAGQLSVIDLASSQVIARMTLTGVGLSSVATSRGLAYAVNTVSHELAVVESISQSVSRYVLPVEPAAVAASEDSGAVYVLGSRPNTVLRIDPTDGTLIGQVTLSDRSGRFGMSLTDSSAFQGLRSRIAINPGDESLYVTLPEAGALSVIPTDLFPTIARDIPWVETPDAPLLAGIPGVVRPAAPPLPSQPAPAVQAQTTTSTDEETN